MGKGNVCIDIGWAPGPRKELAQEELERVVDAVRNHHRTKRTRDRTALVIDTTQAGEVLIFRQRQDRIK